MRLAGAGLGRGLESTQQAEKRTAEDQQARNNRGKQFMLEGNVTRRTEHGNLHFEVTGLHL